MYIDWLVEQVTPDVLYDDIRQIQKEFNIPDERYNMVRIKIDNFLDLMKDGDELWKFDSGRTSFVRLCGRKGYSIVRNGDVVESYITWMS